MLKVNDCQIILFFRILLLMHDEVRLTLGRAYGSCTCMLNLESHCILDVSKAFGCMILASNE